MLTHVYTYMYIYARYPLRIYIYNNGFGKGYNITDNEAIMVEWTIGSMNGLSERKIDKLFATLFPINSQCTNSMYYVWYDR